MLANFILKTKMGSLQKNIINGLDNAADTPLILGLKQMQYAQLYNVLSVTAAMPYEKTISSFNRRELTVIFLICKEKSSKEISIILNMNQRTIERIRMQILKKMQVKTSAGIAIYAIKNGIISFTDLYNGSYQNK